MHSVAISENIEDYTHSIKSSSGFSTDMDKMLMDAAGITTCSEREKCCSSA